MIDNTVKSDILESLKDPILFVGTDHMIQYMNKAAIDHYSKGEELLKTSIFDCHNAESNRVIREVYAAFLQDEEDERLITDNEKHRVYMRVVRDQEGKVVGYYERYEPPADRPTLGEDVSSNG